MKMPWVSRERYEERMHEIAEMRAERERLLDRIAQLAGQPKIYAATEKGSDVEEEPVRRHQVTSRPTLAQALDQAKADADKFAAQGISIVQKIREGSRMRAPHAG